MHCWENNAWRDDSQTGAYKHFNTNTNNNTNTNGNLVLTLILMLLLSIKLTLFIISILVLYICTYCAGNSARGRRNSGDQRDKCCEPGIINKSLSI